MTKTKLQDSIIVGPIKSRRLGLSLGINLLPIDRKLCNFDCIYCECGWDKDYRGEEKGERRIDRFNSREDERRLLEQRLKQLVEEGTPPDVITFSGNGEPTMHPEFAEIVDDVIEIRDRISPKTEIAVLSNATMIGKQHIREALLKVDSPILKLDSAFDHTARLIDNPMPSYSIREVVENMKMFKGELIIQTIFIRGEYNGLIIDNTVEKEVSAWLEILKEVKPRKVMIYTIDRKTPAEGLEKVPLDVLQKIGERVEAELGVECNVAG